jgi:hypothetical protein
MGSIFKSPAPPPPPPPPPPKSKREEKDKADVRRKRLKQQRRGLASTVRTSEQGILTEAVPTKRKSLLGE